MKKSIVSLSLLCLALAAAFCLLGGCAAKPCEHQWTAADCVNAETCTLCGETQGEALGHDWAEATCESPACCTRCGETQGEALDHVWAEATCQSPECCTLCGETRGEALAHSYGQWLLDTDSMYRICDLCAQEEHAEIDYALYLEQYIYGHWNLCSMIRKGRSFYNAEMMPHNEPDPEFFFLPDGSVVRTGLAPEEISKSWTFDRGEYDEQMGQHRIYIRFPEENALSNSSFRCSADMVFYEVVLNDDGDFVTLSNSFGDPIAALLNGTWTTWSADGLYNITFSEDRSFTADIDGEISGFWQPRQPANDGGIYASAGILLNYEKGGKPCTAYASLHNFTLNDTQETLKTRMSLYTDVHENYSSFGLDTAQFLSEAHTKAATIHLGEWTSVDYLVSTPDPETYLTNEDKGLSTEYGITFLEDGTFTAVLRKGDLKGRWKLLEIRRESDSACFVYQLSAPSIETYSYFQYYEDKEAHSDAYLYLCYKNNVSSNYSFRQMTAEEIAAQNELAAAAPNMIVGEWLGSAGQDYSAVFSEDGTFAFRSETDAEIAALHGNWYFNSMSVYENAYTYIYDMETVMEVEGADTAPIDGAVIDPNAMIEPEIKIDPEAEAAEPLTFREDYALVLTIRDGFSELLLRSSYIYGSMVNAESQAITEEKLSAIVGHWSADTAMEYHSNDKSSEEVSADFSLDIAEDGSFTGYAGQNIRGTLEFFENEGDAVHFLARFAEGPQMDTLVMLEDGILSAYVDPYIIDFTR